MAGVTHLLVNTNLNLKPFCPLSYHNICLGFLRCSLNGKSSLAFRRVLGLSGVFLMLKILSKCRENFGRVLFCLFFKKILFVYLFLAALGHGCCVWAFSSCSEQGLLFVAVCRLLIVVASVVVEHGL